MDANTNPELIDFFCSEGQKEAISNTLKLAGWSPENPTIGGETLNKIFNQIFENLNHQKKKGFSFWESDAYYEATANNIDICRRNNKIYFCKQTHNDTGDAPKDPATNPDYWTVLFDFDKPLESTYALINHNHDTTYAKLGGVNTQEFLVKAGTNAKSAVNKEQMETAISAISILGFGDNQDYKEYVVGTQRSVNVTYYNTSERMRIVILISGNTTAPTAGQVNDKQVSYENPQYSDVGTHLLFVPSGKSYKSTFTPNLWFELEDE